MKPKYIHKFILMNPWLMFLYGRSADSWLSSLRRERADYYLRKPFRRYNVRR